MKVYLGQTRSRSLIERLTAYGWGEMTCPTEIPPRRYPWAFDNGAFKDWKLGQPFNETVFLRGCDAMQRQTPPDFMVLPDIVAGGVPSLEYSMGWRDRLLGLAPLYLAVQDGMTAPDVAPIIDLIDGLFVGGTTQWKVRSGSSWVALGQRFGKPCHIGRVGTARRVRWARRIGADSLDSCLPLWSEDNLRVFVEAIMETPALELW